VSKEGEKEMHCEINPLSKNPKKGSTEQRERVRGGGREKQRDAGHIHT